VSQSGVNDFSRSPPGFWSSLEAALTVADLLFGHLARYRFHVVIIELTMCHEVFTDGVEFLD
jgi:hypothetical protein